MIPVAVVDAFADKPFAGNPAAVCLLGDWPSDEWLQLVAREMNLSETAFLVHRRDSEFELRWFTPRVEVSLCGHATLASAHVLWESGRVKREPLRFSTKSGVLSANLLPSGEIELDFPSKPAQRSTAPSGLEKALGVCLVDTGRNGFDYLVELDSAEEVRNLKPDFDFLRQVECRGVIVTAKSDDPRFDFVSRFFAPRAGVNEDPVTGSAHCCLSEWWGEKLGKTDLVGYQASERGGVIRIKRRGMRVRLIGQAHTIWRGEVMALPS